MQLFELTILAIDLLLFHEINSTMILRLHSNFQKLVCHRQRTLDIYTLLFKNYDMRENCRD